MAKNFDSKKILKSGAMGLFVLVVVLLGVQLFFGDQIALFANSYNGTPVENVSADTLTIAYSLPLQSLEPTLFDPITRSRLVNVYEGLVRTNHNLKIEPAIAVSWGLITPTTWEFTLRPHVKFHTGSEVSAADVVASLERARTFEGSQLKTLLNSVSDVKAVSDTTVRITTKTPDPLLLNKLAVTYIFPKSLADFEQPVGTGPYSFVAWNKGETVKPIMLKRFENYWSEKPHYGQVVLQNIGDRDARINALKTGKVDLLADVPPASAKGLSSDTITLKTIPSLEVSFVMLNENAGLFQDKNLRETFADSLDRKTFVDISGGYAQPVKQFVSSGVFGFNPKLKGYDYDFEKAKSLSAPIVSQATVQPSVTLDYAEGSDAIAQYLQDQLRLLGIELKLNPLGGLDFQRKLQSGTSEMYYLGWRSELGDAGDFLQSIVHSGDASGDSGAFNGTKYSNKNVDDLIDKSQQDLNVKARLKSLQDAMKVIVEDDIAGVPLFETQTIFAFQNKIKFEPRVDGYIYAAEIK